MSEGYDAAAAARLEDIRKELRDAVRERAEMHSDIRSIDRHLTVLNGRMGKAEEDLQALQLSGATRDGAREAVGVARRRDLVIAALAVSVIAVGGQLVVAVLTVSGP